ncbi:MAG TPA: TonB-dependent receptor [Hyphomonadaceae bacterium]|nr:TonB-dependent receptor [Hyphomonadaceae bacterium]HPN05239.1 TonB-dependent receptor [Hyphomonadaceae bacterium]
MRLKFRKSSWLVGVAGAALCLNAMSAVAQTAPVSPDQGPQPTAETTEENDQVIISGRRPLAESEAASLEIQRASDSIVSVLSADAIGNLPDQNIAFAIGRLPGVGLERDQGQARYVNLRGTPNYWTTLSFDGLSIVSPEGRATRFDNIPSALAKQVVISKAITPDMPGDTVAGNVNVITRSALDYDGLTINGKLGIGYVALGGGEETDSNFVISDRFLDGRLGLLAQGSYYRRNMVTENQETDPFLQPRAARPTDRVAREFENKLYRLTRENQSLSFRADYQFDDANTIFWNNVWTNYTDEELRNNYIFRLDQGTNAAGQNYNTSRDNGTILPFAGTVYGARLNINTNSLESEEDIYTSTLGGEHKDLAGWDFSWRANYTYTADGRDAGALPSWQSPSGAADRPSLVYDFNDPEHHDVRLYRTIVNGATRSLGAPINSVDDLRWDFLNISKRTGGDETQAATFKGDASHEFDAFGIPVDFKAGAMYTDRIKKSDEQVWLADRAGLVAAGLTPPEVLAGGPTASWQNLFLKKPYLADNALNYNFSYHSKTAVEAYVNELQRLGVAKSQDTSANWWKVNEKIAAAYAMGTFDFDWGNIVAGARIEQVKNSGTAITTLGATREMVTIEKSETEVYPSAHINWDINDEMKLRVGLTSSASRPDFDDLRPNLTINDALQTVSGGNPDAKPEKQKGIDMYYEWYMEPEGFFSAGVFYKDITDVLFSKSRVFGLTDFDTTTNPNRNSYTFTGITNGGDGWLQGFEVFYSQTAQNLVNQTGMPDWLGGFGLRASATFTDSEVTIPSANSTSPERKIKLPGTSDEVYNVQLTYEKYNLSVRLAYQFRTAWRQSVGDYALVGTTGILQPVSNGDIYWNDDEEIDLSIRYQVSDNLEWYFDASNIGDQEAIRYGDSKMYPIEIERFGPRYTTGIRFNF